MVLLPTSSLPLVKLCGVRDRIKALMPASASLTSSSTNGFEINGIDVHARSKHRSMRAMSAMMASMTSVIGAIGAAYVVFRDGSGL